jgi:hypothetical protein
MQTSTVFLAVGAALLFGCKDDDKSKGTPAASATATASAAPSATASATASATPSATASAAPAHECAKGTTGEGTFSKPCDAKGKDRAMEVQWTGKTDEKGPHFRVVNKAAATILYGKLAVYFYDKAGKQIEVKDSAGKAHPFHTCAGNMFSGVMKPQEKAVITFSCVTQKDVPEGATAIEGEMQMVGFTDAAEKKIEWYWRNAELTPDARKKGAK